MTVLAEVVDESVKGMEASLVSKADQEKVCRRSSTSLLFNQLGTHMILVMVLGTSVDGVDEWGLASNDTPKKSISQH